MAEATEYDHRISEAASLRIYDMLLSSYKLKKDLVGLAQALQVLEKGTISDLTNRIKTHLAINPNLTANSQFSSLFNSHRQNHHNHTQHPSNSGTSSIPIVPSPTSHISMSPIPGPSSQTGMFSVPFVPGSSSQQAIPGPPGLTVHPHYLAHQNYYYTFHNPPHHPL